MTQYQLVHLEKTDVRHHSLKGKKTGLFHAVYNTLVL